MVSERLVTRIFIASALIVLLNGCGESYDRIRRTEFVSTDGRGFRFKAVGGDSQDEEASRRRQLDEWLKINSMCAGGYRIEKRTPIVKNVSVFGDNFYDIWYEGRCT